MRTCGACCWFMSGANACSKHPYESAWAFRPVCNDYAETSVRHEAVTTATNGPSQGTGDGRMRKDGERMSQERSGIEISTKECPLCGCVDLDAYIMTIGDTLNRAVIRCMDCGCEMKVLSEVPELAAKEAAKRWNRRTYVGELESGVSRATEYIGMIKRENELLRELADGLTYCAEHDKVCASVSGGKESVCPLRDGTLVADGQCRARSIRAALGNGE